MEGGQAGGQAEDEEGSGLLFQGEQAEEGAFLIWNPAGTRLKERG